MSNVFKIIGIIREIETIAIGSRIREIKKLRERFGGDRWLKRKGIAEIQLQNGRIRLAELHWMKLMG